MADYTSGLQIIDINNIVPVAVTNINDDPTAIALDNETIAENEDIGTVVGSFSTTDVDSSSFTYSLVAGAGDTDNDSFEIVNGQLKTKASFDFETQANYTIRVQTDDNNGGTFQQPFTITVEGVNDDPTAIALDNETIAENEDIGTVVGSFSTTDVDSSSFTYSLVAGAGDTDNDSFEIVNGQLKTKASFDFETQANYTIRVQTDDNNGGTFQQQLTVTVEGVNEAGEGSITGQVREDSPLTVTITDPDNISGNISYQWQSSTDGNTWNDIPGATNNTFTCFSKKAHTVPIGQC